MRHGRKANVTGTKGLLQLELLRSATFDHLSCRNRYESFCARRLKCSFVPQTLTAVAFFRTTWPFSGSSTAFPLAMSAMFHGLCPLYLGSHSISSLMTLWRYHKLVSAPHHFLDTMTQTLAGRHHCRNTSARWPRRLRMEQTFNGRHLSGFTQLASEPFRHFHVDSKSLMKGFWWYSATLGRNIQHFATKDATCEGGQTPKLWHTVKDASNSLHLLHFKEQCLHQINTFPLTKCKSI